MTIAEAAELLGIAPTASRDELESRFARLLSATEAALRKAGSVEARAELEIHLAELAAAREVLTAPREAHDPTGGPEHEPDHHGAHVGLGLVLGLVAATVVLTLAVRVVRDREATNQLEVIPPAATAAVASPAPAAPPTTVAPAPATPLAAPLPLAPATPAEAPATAATGPATAAATPAAPVREPAPATRYHVVSDPDRGALVALYRQPLLVLPAAQVEAARRVCERLEALQQRAVRLSQAAVDNLVQVGLEAPHGTPLLFSLDGATVAPLLRLDATVTAATGWRDPYSLAVYWRGLLTDALRLIGARPAAHGLARAAGGALQITLGPPSYRNFRGQVEALPPEAQRRLAAVAWQQPPGEPAASAPRRAELARVAEVEVQTNFGSRLALRKRIDVAGSHRTLGCGERLQPLLLFGYWLQVKDPATRATGFVQHRDPGGDLVYPPPAAKAAAERRRKRLLGGGRWRSFGRGAVLRIARAPGVELRAEPCECAAPVGRFALGRRVEPRAEVGDWLAAVDDQRRTVYFRWREGAQRYVEAWLSPAEVLAGKWIRYTTDLGGLSAEFPRTWAPTRNQRGAWTFLEYREAQDGVQLSLAARAIGWSEQVSEVWGEIERDLAARHGRQFAPLETRQADQTALARYRLTAEGVTWRATTGVTVAGGYAYRWQFAAREADASAWQRVLERFQESVTWPH